MADQSDVEIALVGAIASALYPQDISAPSIVAATCRVYRGTPTSAALSADLAAGVVNVTVIPDASAQENTTRFPDEPRIISSAVPGLTIGVDGVTATLAGQATMGQVAGLLVDNLAVVHRIQAGDSPALVAATLGTYLRSRRLVLVNGASITMPGARAVIGRVVSDQVVQRETRRQQQRFKVSVWCPSPSLRDLVAATIDQAFSASLWLPLVDGTSGYLRAISSAVLDQSQNTNLYRRDLTYSVEYPTVITTIVPSMIFGDLLLTPADAGSVQTLLA